MNNKNILFLTLVHPDFLPPVYALAQTLRDLGYNIHILTFDSFTPTAAAPEQHIELESVGKHHGVSFMQRWKLRRKFEAKAAAIIAQKPKAIIAFCPFSVNTAIKKRNNTPVIYFALEIADFVLGHFKRSPLNFANNLIALWNVKRTELVATPSVQRSAWLAGRCHLNHMPHTIFNAAYVKPNTETQSTYEIFKKVVPVHFLSKTIILYTGAVNSFLCIQDLVNGFLLLNNPHCALAITGMKDNEYCNAIRATVQNSGLKENILLLPYVAREEMLALQSHATIGACMVREKEDDIETKMIAPNKVGEYLNKGLFLLSVKSEYMKLFEANKIATLTHDLSAESIKNALLQALERTKTEDYKVDIRRFVNENYCMQKQAEPIIKYLNSI